LHYPISTAYRGPHVIETRFIANEGAPFGSAQGTPSTDSAQRIPSTDFVQGIPSTDYTQGTPSADFLQGILKTNSAQAPVIVLQRSLLERFEMPVF